MRFGVDYYPEHWEPELWERDIHLMKEAGINMIRIGEFAWSLLEKEKGSYDFSLFDQAIEMFGNHGIQIVLGTPTATPPAWMCTTHPDILAVEEGGRQISFGGRRQYCYNSMTYQSYVESMVTALAKQYKDNPVVIGFQIDNELGHEESDRCYCENCKQSFGRWLQNKYDSIDKVNKTWGTVFWSQTYTAWEQIPIPKLARTAHNPTLELEYRRFMSDSIVKFCNLQVKILRAVLPDHVFITSNQVTATSGKSLNVYALSEQLDFISYDNYPVWGGLETPVPPWETALHLDSMRGMKNKPFWVMEQLVGAQGHRIMGYNPRPGQIKLWSYQAIARGAEALLYFRWRAAHFGAEQFCHGVLDHDNIPRRKYQELKEMHSELYSIGDDILEAKQTPSCAFIHGYDNMWAWQIQPLSKAFQYQQELMKLYRPLFEHSIATDIMQPGRELSQYKVVVAPLLYLCDALTADKLKTFVEHGGDLILTYRSGVKDENNLIRREVLPGLLQDLAGIQIEEYESLQPGQYNRIEGVEGSLEGGKYQAGVWADIIHCQTATPLAIYKDTFYDGKAAVTMNRYGKGLVYYIGCSLEEVAIDVLYRQIFTAAGVPWKVYEQDIEVVIKESDIYRYWFVMNHGAQKRTAQVEGESLLLQPYEARIIRKNKI